jgi:hypothetical protein
MRYKLCIWQIDTDKHGVPFEAKNTIEIEGNSLIELVSKIPLLIVKFMLKEQELNERQKLLTDDDIPF